MLSDKYKAGCEKWVTKKNSRLAQVASLLIRSRTYHVFIFLCGFIRLYLKFIKQNAYSQILPESQWNRVREFWTDNKAKR